MGMNVNVFRWTLGDCTNGGLSGKFDTLCVVNVEGPFAPDAEHPAFELVEGPGGEGHVILRPVGEKRWTMFGGNYGATSDGRFCRAIEAMTGYEHSFPVAIHDRCED